MHYNYRTMCRKGKKNLQQQNNNKNGEDKKRGKHQLTGQ